MDLHLSPSEPRIFPGLVSRSQRRDSLRQSSMSETDRDESGSTMRSGKGTATVDGTADGVNEAVEESDGEYEEAGGRDE